LIVTLGIVAVAALLAGGDGALSAVLGGLVNVTATVAYAVLWGLGLKAAPGSAAMSLMAIFRAEAAKVLLIVGGLWLVLSIYWDVLPVAFFCAFIATVVIFSLALFVRE
jgi:F0F1-type ATP synthase assembly protein I